MISVMISVLPSLSVSVKAFPLLLGGSYSSLPLLVRASHAKVLKIAHLKLWEGVLVLKDQYSYLQTPLFHFLPDHQLWEGVVVRKDQ